MGRRDLLSNEERALLFGIPETREGLINHYTLSRSDMEMIMSRRQPTTRLGFALQLSLLRHPGFGMAGHTDFEPLVGYLAEQLNIPPIEFSSYGRRPQIISEHLMMLMEQFRLRAASESDLPMMISAAEEAALATDLGLRYAMKGSYSQHPCESSVWASLAGRVVANGRWLNWSLP
jgi:Domain of unknown function (DUF4158)